MNQVQLAWLRYVIHDEYKHIDAHLDKPVPADHQQVLDAINEARTLDEIVDACKRTNVPDDIVEDAIVDAVSPEGHIAPPEWIAGPHQPPEHPLHRS